MLRPKRLRVRSSLPAQAKERAKPSPQAQGWRKTTNYRQWRAVVLARDHKTCAFCGAKKNLTAHHIIPAAVAPELRYAHLNGITLCRNCHRALDRAVGDHFVSACSDACAFVRIMRLIELVRSTGDRRQIVWE